MRKWTWAAALALVACAGLAVAAGPKAVREQIEASMLVSGTIDIDPEGRVTAYQLDQAKKLPTAIDQVIGRRVTEWRFEPVQLDGRAVRARSPMQLRLVAKKSGEEYLVRIAGATFGAPEPGESPRKRGKLAAPRYPELAALNGVGGTVYLVLRIGRDGTVEDLIAEQVNLRVVANERQMERWREMFANAVMKTAKEKWSFDPPTSGPEVDAPFWSIRVPVEFIPPGGREDFPGEWNAYVPGPQQNVPWRNWDDLIVEPDSIATGGVYPDRPVGPRLLTPLSDS